MSPTVCVLLKLPEPVRDMLAEGSLSAGHARALVSTPDPVALAKVIAAKGMSVRDAERLAQNHIKSQGASQPAEAREPKDSDTIALERSLSIDLDFRFRSITKAAVAS